MNNESTSQRVSWIGEKHWNWKGGRIKSSNGYMLVKKPGEKYIPEHILIMEKHIGRDLIKGEVVHHKNRVRDDNRIENLQLMTNSEHLRMHMIGSKASDETRALYRKIRKGTNQKEKHQQWKYNVTKDSIIEALSKFETQRGAAESLGICADTLRARLKHYGLYKQYRRKNGRI